MEMALEENRIISTEVEAVTWKGTGSLLYGAITDRNGPVGSPFLLPLPLSTWGGGAGVDEGSRSARTIAVGRLDTYARIRWMLVGAKVVVCGQGYRLLTVVVSICWQRTHRPASHPFICISWWEQFRLSMPLSVVFKHRVEGLCIHWFQSTEFRVFALPILHIQQLWIPLHGGRVKHGGGDLRMNAQGQQEGIEDQGPWAARTPHVSITGGEARQSMKIDSRCVLTTSMKINSECVLTFMTLESKCVPARFMKMNSRCVLAAFVKVGTTRN